MRHGYLIAAVAVLIAAWPGPAGAGDAQRMEIVAATPDGTHYALFDIENGDVKSCGLAKVTAKSASGEATLVVSAVCTDPDGRLLAVEKWTWPRPLPEIAALRTFDGKAVGKLARITTDEDTQPTAHRDQTWGRLDHRPRARRRHGPLAHGCPTTTRRNVAADGVQRNAE